MDGLCVAVGFATISPYHRTIVSPQGFVERRLRSGPLGRLPADLIAKVCAYLPEGHILVLIAAGAPKVRTTVICVRHSQGSRSEYGPPGCGGFGCSVLKATVLITLGVQLEVAGTGRLGREGLTFVAADHELLGKTIFMLRLRKLWTTCKCGPGVPKDNGRRCQVCGRCRSVEELRKRLILAL